MMTHTTYKWWKEAVGYQIFPKTFYDSNQDGIGDLQGIIKKLPYLKELGINFIWICPFFESPMDDNGYDISDFYAVHKIFGTLDDAKALIKASHALGIKVIIDLVLNHTSDEHPWFQDVKNNKESQYKDYYILKEGTATQPPNNWGSFFGGSAWKQLYDNTYYLKIFSDKMPDLNWNYQPLRKALHDIARWWLNLGVDGFRIDAVAHIEKNQSYKNAPSTTTGVVYDWSMFSNLPKVHTYLKTFNQEVLAPFNAFSVGEVGGGATVEDALKYCGYTEQALDLTFTFDHLSCPDMLTFKKTLAYWQTELFGKAWYPLYLNNHDTNRSLSRYGHALYQEKSAKALATLMFCLWGTPFIYQGEEIGMTNYPFTKIEQFNDISAQTQYHVASPEQKEDVLNKLIQTSRDHTRTTMQWDNTKYGGFTAGETKLLVNDNYTTINVAIQQQQKNSVWHHYKQLIELKKTNQTFIYGKIHFIEETDPNVISYYRYDDYKRYLIIVNMSDKCLPYSIKDKLIQSHITTLERLEATLLLNPFDAFILEVEQ